ncbi:hypothetical protein DY000_02052122 [Brassica cretica]|uniref:Ubiquitin-like protease family profile domain-containing protein n=1 Tax=Brassica cretica TaxID=69181 RepID=A0ABQ7AJA3_BRACR|nr:hypothetical protein DY000_02052122 [Brassica cretica]
MLKGSPLALQMLAYQTAPNLLSTIPIPFDSHSIMDLVVPHLPLYPVPSINDILSVEADPDLIADNYHFEKHLWHGGDTSQPITTPATDEDEPILQEKSRKSKAPRKKAAKSKPPPKNALKPRKTSKKNCTTRKQRCISSYFQSAASSSTSNDKILELLSAISEQTTKLSDQVSELKNESKLLRKLLKRKKTPTCLKRSAFHTLLDLSKKGRQAHRGCQTEPTEPTTADLSHQTSPKPMEDDHLFSHSPVVSQYEAHLHGSTSLRKQTTKLSAEPVHTTPTQASPVHTSPLHASPVHTSPLNPSPVHTTPLQASPVHTTPLQASPIQKSPAHSSPLRNSPCYTTPPSNRPPSVIYDASAHPNSPEIHHLLFHGKEIFELVSPDPPSFTQPKYDSSTNQASRRQISPLSPFSFTPETSPNKSSDSLIGFVGHATAINAFSATATSNPFSVANTIPPYIQAQSTEDSDIVELSDGSPARERPRHMPSMEENHLAKELYRCKSVPALDLISPLPQIQWDLFEKIISKHKAAFHITPSKFDFSNNFLLQLAEPTHWTTTYHMKILMHMLGARHSRLLEEQKLAFITPHLASGIQAISKSFNKSRKRETFLWDDQLTDLVLQPGRRWMEDVFTVYTPMIWADKHWVGLAINLDLGCVEILDPFPTLYSDRSVARFMAPVLKSLPYLVKKVANYQLTQFRGLQPFTCHRVSNLYINEIGGDCGPVTVKFLEMHTHGDPDPDMSSITDRKVDDIRKQYALDIYKTIVMPAYYAPPRA